MLEELQEFMKILEIKAKERVLDLFSGMYRSAFKGNGIEFDELREYVPGDDVRAISWTKFAQQGKPFIKTYREERDLTVLFCVDISPSLFFASHSIAKRRKAVEIVAELSFSAICNNDKVGLVLFSDKVEKYIPAKRGAKHALCLLKECLESRFDQSKKMTTDVAKALQFATKITKKRAILFLISDFQAESYAKEFLLAAKKDDLVTIFLSDAYERNPLPLGLVSVEDPETKEQVVCDFDEKATLRIQKFYQKRREALQMLCSKASADLIEIDTQEKADLKLREFFAKRKKLREKR